MLESYLLDVCHVSLHPVFDLVLSCKRRDSAETVHDSAGHNCGFANHVAARGPMLMRLVADRPHGCVGMPSIVSKFFPNPWANRFLLWLSCWAALGCNQTGVAIWAAGSRLLIMMVPLVQRLHPLMTAAVGGSCHMRSRSAGAGVPEDGGRTGRHQW